MNQNSHFDMIIAGGGVAGLLAFSRYLCLKKPCSLLLLEHSSRFGGKANIFDSDHWPLGSLGLCHSDIKNFFLNTVYGLDHFSEDLESYFYEQDPTIGVISGKTIEICLYGQWESLAYALGGTVGKKKFQSFYEKLMKESVEDSSIGKFLKTDKKDPIFLVLSQIGRLFGTSNVPSCDLQSFKAWLNEPNKLFFVDWNQIATELFSYARKQSCYDFHISLENSILKCSFQELLWQCETKKGFFWTKKIVIAQKPWTSSKWLEQTSTPTGILYLESKKKPVASVCLSEKLTQNLDLPGTILIPSEGVEAFHYKGKAISYQMIMDYEHSFDPHAVEKAVRKLKKAQSKVHAILSNDQKDCLYGEFITICPEYIPQSLSFQDVKINSDFETKDWYSETYGFVSSAYGTSIFSHKNLIDSILNTFTSTF